MNLPMIKKKSDKTVIIRNNLPIMRMISGKLLIMQNCIRTISINMFHFDWGIYFQTMNNLIQISSTE